MFYEDLSPCLYYSSLRFPPSEKLKAVGWLAEGHSFTRRQAQMSELRFGKLLTLLQNPWEPGHWMGYHRCEFCPEVAPKKYEQWSRMERDGLVIYFGANNLFVPGESCIYVAPSMVVHYIDAHAYEPPEVFWEAVMNCPEMGSEAYIQALTANGPADESWVRATSGTL